MSGFGQAVPSDAPATPRVYLEYGATLEPMDAAHAYRDLKRERKEVKAREAVLIEQENRLVALIKTYIEGGKLPPAMNVEGGGNIHLKNEIRPFFKAEVTDAQIDRVLRDNGLDHLLGKPNHNSLRGYVLQYLDDDKSKPARERLKPDSIPSELLDMLVIEDNIKVAVNGL